MDPEKIKNKTKLTSPQAFDSDALPAVSSPAGKTDAHGTVHSDHNNKSRRPNQPRFVFNFNYLVYALLLFFFCVGLRDTVDQRQSITWDKTTAIVISAGLNENDHMPRAKWSVPVKVAYSYAYKGQKYLSNKINFCRVFSVYENASGPAYKQLMAVCKPEAKIAIFYDPKNPTEAVLDRTQDPGDWMLLLGCPLTAVFLYMMSALGTDRIWWLEQGKHADLGALFRPRR